MAKDYRHTSRLRLFIVLAACWTQGCMGPHRRPLAEQRSPDASPTRRETVPPQGADATLDIASWNLDWFGDTTNGPTDDALQTDRVRTVVASADMDIWGFAEVVTGSSWTALTGSLTDYAGLLASDGDVAGGSNYYDETEQKVALLYKTSLATVQDARVILTEYDADFAGRPPLQVTLRVTLGETTEDAVLIVIHAKCCSDAASWKRRVNASNALKTYLDSQFPSEKVWVIGDFNDDVDMSTAVGRPSPYTNFVTDTTHYAFATRELSDAHLGSTVDYPETIDHHLVTNEAYAKYIPGSASVYRVDQYLENYATTTSDHYPVLSHYLWSESNDSDAGVTGDRGDPSNSDVSSGDGPNVIINEVGANEPGNDTGAEFVELLNTGSAPADISSWHISDRSTIRHAFSAGTTLAPGKALVVFGDGAAIPSGLTNALAASTGKLGLANSGDSVTLSDPNGVPIDAVTYPASLAAVDGVSMNRSPDGKASVPFALHTTLSTLTSSPGKRVDGSEW